MSDPLVVRTKAEELVAVLTAQGHTVATAESLTAGLLSATLAGVPGASRVLQGGLVVYATKVKQALTGLSDAEVKEHGVVSGYVATHLARAAARECKATWGIGLTGVAGPDPQEGKEPGTVFLAIAQGITGPVKVVSPSLTGDRWDIRHGCVTAAITGLLHQLSAVDHSLIPSE